MAVSNGDAGLITFGIDIPSHPVMSDDLHVRLWVDADRNAATGLADGVRSTSGWDYYILWDRKVMGPDPQLFRCERAKCTNDSPQRTFRYSYAGGPRFTILDAELGNTKRFRFYVETVDGVVRDETVDDYTNARWDFAPALGSSWDYLVRLAPTRLVARALSVEPATPRAGATLAVRLTATERPSGVVLTSGRVSCAATVGGKAVQARSQGFVGKHATCVFAIPADAAGKTLRGSIAVGFKGKTVSRSFTRRIA